MISSFNCGMALRTQAYKIAQVISRYVVILETTPGCLMMHVKRPAYLLFSYAAFLAGMVITITRQCSLSEPVYTPPFTVSALPVWMIAYPMPHAEAVKRAEDIAKQVALLLVLNHTTPLSKIFATYMTGKYYPCIGSLTGHRTELRVEVFIAMARNLKWLSALYASYLYQLRRGIVHTFIRAVAIFPTVRMKHLAACLASVFGMLLDFTLTCTLLRTVFLFPVLINSGNQFAAIFTNLFHELIIAQEVL